MRREPGPRISHALLLTIAQLSRAITRLLFVVVTARVLGPQQFGVYALLLALLEIVAVASGAGYMDYLTREAARDECLGWGAASQLALLRLICLAPLSAAGLLVLWALGYPRLVLLAGAWLLASLAPRSVSEAIQGVLRGVGRYFAYLSVELAFDFTLLGGLSYLLAQRGGLHVVIMAEILAACAAAILSASFYLMFRTHERARLNGRELVEKSTIFSLYSFIGNLYDRLDIVLLSKLGGNYATGVYSAAYRPLGTIQLLPYGILYSLLPSLSRGEYGEADMRKLEKAMGLLLCASFFIVLATMAFADVAVPFVFGNRFAETAVALKVLIWAVIFRYLNYALNIGLLAARKEKVFIATSLICLAVNVICNLAFIPSYSWRAAAVVTTLTEMVLFAQNIWWLRRLFGVAPKPFGWARSSIAFCLLLAAAVGGSKLISPVVVGSACLLVFVLYLYRTGLLEDLTVVWSASSGKVVEGSNS